MNHRLNERKDILPDTKSRIFFLISFSRLSGMPTPPNRLRRILKPGKLAQLQAAKLKGAQEVSAFQLRKIFHDAAVEERLANGELTTKLVYNVHVEPPLPFEPPCTHSRRIAYYDTYRVKVAEVHFYQRPDGSIAASGMLDPKEVLHDGVRYFYDQG